MSKLPDNLALDGLMHGTPKYVLSKGRRSQPFFLTSVFVWLGAKRWIWSLTRLSWIVKEYYKRLSRHQWKIILPPIAAIYIPRRCKHPCSATGGFG